MKTKRCAVHVVGHVEGVDESWLAQGTVEGVCGLSSDEVFNYCPVCGKPVRMLALLLIKQAKALAAKKRAQETDDQRRLRAGIEKLQRFVMENPTSSFIGFLKPGKFPVGLGEVVRGVKR